MVRKVCGSTVKNRLIWSLPISLMSEKTWQGTLKKLQKLSPGVKIIAMATYGDMILSRAKDLGALHILYKPIQKEELQDAVNDALEEKA